MGEYSILGPERLTAKLLTSYATSHKEDHTMCTPDHCVHENDAINGLAMKLANETKQSPEFQKFLFDHVEATAEVMALRGTKALVAGAMYFVYLGWELAKYSLESNNTKEVM